METIRPYSRGTLGAAGILPTRDFHLDLGSSFCCTCFGAQSVCGLRAARAATSFVFQELYAFGPLFSVLRCLTWIPFMSCIHYLASIRLKRTALQPLEFHSAPQAPYIRSISINVLETLALTSLSTHKCRSTNPEFSIEPQAKHPEIEFESTGASLAAGPLSVFAFVLAGNSAAQRQAEGFTVRLQPDRVVSEKIPCQKGF